MNRKGLLFVISGPSGVGKGTIVSEIMKKLGEDRVKLSISATTREMREGDADGVTYYFLSEEDFLDKVEKGQFLEYAKVHAHYYGTPKPPVVEAIEAGRDVILEIDVQGAMKVRSNFGEGAYIFILPPSMKELRNRLTGRGTEKPEEVERRMHNAAGEIEMADKYDYAVTNDDLDSAVDEVMAIMKAEHCRVDNGAHDDVERIKEEI